MYRCITGIRPDESMERIISDQVKSPSEMGIAIGKPQELALMRGMAVLMANRFQSIPLLYSAMYGAVPIGEDVHIKAEHPASVQHKAQPGGNQDMRTEYANPRGHTQMENSKNGFGSAQITAGGADVTQFDEKTLESKLVKNLFACGEVLDIDGACGGYNLQWAWASGYVAATAAVKN